MNTFEILNEASYDRLKGLWLMHYDWSGQNKRVSGSPKWWDEPLGLNVMGVRDNSENDVNNGKYNDWLCLTLNKDNGAYTKVILKVTVDPAHLKNGVAHLRQGCYEAYRIRPHNYESWDFPEIGVEKRWAICNDTNPVCLLRTNGSGQIISSEWKIAKINIHDKKNYYDPSAGCTVIELILSYVRLYMPLLYDRVSKKIVPVNFKNITYCLVNHVNLEMYVQQTVDRVERAEVEDGFDRTVTIEPKKATESKE